MQKTIKTKKGLDIKLIGDAEKSILEFSSEFYAIKPTDYIGISPKLVIKVGDKVKAGSVIFYDKLDENIVFTSPVSGIIHDVVRGEKRKLLEIQIKADSVQEYEDFKIANFESLSRDLIIQNLLKSGTWPFIRQRPYNVIANPNQSPKAIFISAFDSSPLAPDLDFILEPQIQTLQKGINILKKLTEGKIHLSFSKEKSKSNLYNDLQNVEIHEFSGPHPAGNVGIQIHHIDPIQKGDIVWTIGVQDLLTIARLFTEGKYIAEKVIALTGSEIIHTRYYKIKYGASIKNMITNNVKPGEIRFISGNVLTGDKISQDGFIGTYHQQVTAIPEGKYYEFFGWALPGLNRFSISKTFFSWLTPNKKFMIDTNTHGEKRAFVMTGQYDKVLPMNIFPVILLKAILAEDIDKMEQLGIYEIDEEDFALCEVICTSKIDVQQIVRTGLDLMRKEMN